MITQLYLFEKVYTSVTDDNFPEFGDYVILEIDRGEGHREFEEYISSHIGQVVNKIPNRSSFAIQYIGIPDHLNSKYLTPTFLQNYITGSMTLIGGWDNFDNYDIKYWSSSKSELERIPQIVTKRFDL